MAKKMKVVQAVKPARTRRLTIENIRLDQLLPHPDNARSHSRQQIRWLSRSIIKNGPMRPILADGDNRIIAGHGVCEGAKLAGLTYFPVIRVTDLTPAEARAYSILDNRLAEKSQWDKKKLAEELSFLTEAGFEIEDTGFEVAEADIIIADAADAQTDDSVEDLIPERAPGKSVSRTGDCWTLGAHRLLCGDALHSQSYDTLLGRQCADFVFTDPPYNVPIGGHVSGKGRVKHREFAVASGEMPAEQYTDFLERLFELMAACSVPGAVLQVCIDWRHVNEMTTAGRRVYGAKQLLNICVWRKNNAGMGSLYRSQHELVCVFRNGDHPHINNIELGRHGRSRSNVWDYAGVNTFKKDRMTELQMHPTVKPVAMVADAIKDCSARNAVVLDPFAGSGTILVAAEKTGRAARAIELDPAYVDVAVRRWEVYTGQFAVHEATGASFEEIGVQRQSSAQPPRWSIRDGKTNRS
jgi:DNA modification methylase